GGCQALLGERLAAAGFALTPLPFNQVTNLWARRGRGQPLLAFAGHTDVVPPGSEARWSQPPYAGAVVDGILYGRGTADMKGSLAAMVTACERFVSRHPRHRGAIALLLTSDEEGPGVDGTRRVVDYLQARGETIDYCLVGEPSCEHRLGDTVKNGRRGSLHGHLTVQGVQGHVAYPHQVHNPIHLVGAIIAALGSQHWDKGDDFFPPTSFQATNLHGGTGASNVVPEQVELWFNFRFSPQSPVERLQDRVQTLVDTALLNEEVRSGHRFGVELEWRLSGVPFVTPPGVLVDALKSAIETVTGLTPVLATSGGTSDGRFIAPTGAQVVEFGPCNATIHQVDERVSLEDLDALSAVYEALLVQLLG
ncbi:MAG: succinyl-diaminopimelate desuccinylase, partial [Candidatus Competibacterales bacterium]